MARLPSAGKAIAALFAVVLAFVATIAIYSYVQGIEQRAFDDAELVEVFVAQELIPEGLSVTAASEAGLIARENAPRATVPDGALGSLDQVEGLVTESRILPGEVVVRDRWVDPDEVSDAVLDIPAGFEAVSVQVGIPPGVAGFVRAGDQVSLLATVTQPEVTVEEDEATGEAAEAAADEVLTQYLLQGIDVLAVGQRVVTEEGEDGMAADGGAVLLTVALEPEDVERLVFAIGNAELYFTLLPEDAEPVDTPGRTLQDLFN